jgi:hypothetical protein
MVDTIVLPVLAGLVLGLILIGLFASYFNQPQSIFSRSPFNGVPDSEIVDSELDQDTILDAKESSSYAVALADPRVSRYTANAYNFNNEFFPKGVDGRSFDEVNLKVLTKQTVTGDWTASYEVIYSEINEIKVELDDGAVREVSVNAVPDETRTIVFTEQQKDLIRTVLADSKIRQQIAGKDNVYVLGVSGGVYSPVCQPASCWAVTLQQANTKNTLVALVNTSTNQVVKLYPIW